MEGIRTYLLQIISTALICGILIRLMGNKGLLTETVKLLAGVIMIITLLSPWVSIHLGSLEEITGNFSQNAESAVMEGKISAHEAISQIIKERSETYILDKACVDRALEREEGKYDFAVLDIHAEATGEKAAIGYAYDGKISVVFGTHTHVPTCDEIILPKGTGYISDIGMCGESGGVLGMNPELVVKHQRCRAPIRFEPASGEAKATGAIFDVDVNSGKVNSIKRITF